MKVSSVFLLAACIKSAEGADDFNYRETQGRDYGPNDWDEVGCDNLENCPGWPDKHIGSVGFQLTDFPNNCEWCPIEGNSCGQHRQSPIDLQRDRADPDSPNVKECEDWHWMQFKDGTCDWEDVQDQFIIGRSGLTHKIPVKNNGDIDCKALDGERRFPRLDYSKGYSDWWFLSQTDISVPSEHVQHGKRYDAEVVLSHFYEFDHPWNMVGKVAIFLDAYENEAPWHFLDKLICQWRRVEEKSRSNCNLPPAPVYKMCELYRGQTRSAEDFESPTEQVTYPTYTPLVAPKAIPIVNYGGEPPLEKIPLKLCEGDCDFPTDCAKGLICHRRDAYEAVPGCIGGEQDFTNTDYCVFDVYGVGYTQPTDSPTQNPTATMRPTITPLEPKPLSFFGSTVTAENLPLQICEGDCDNDDHCGEGLICFQREENMPVPGCIGNDPNKTDYCILDPHGEGYTFPPTGTPTTGEPTIAEPTAAPFVLPTGAAKSIDNLGWSPPAPIGECQGDCDEDSDCGPHLYCYQRNSQFEAVPGCMGGENDATLTDYCTFREAEPTVPPVTVPTISPTPPPTANPTAKPSVAPVPTLTPTETAPTLAPTMGPFKRGEIKFLGWTPDKLILDLCEGDCDKDDHCAPGLLCYDREGQYDPVPGCDGAELNDSLSDFCFDPRVYDTTAPTDGSAVPSAATPAPTDAPSKTSTPPPFVSPTTAPNTPGPTFDPIQSLCISNGKCLQQGIPGFCCPTQNGEFLDCCETDAPTGAPTSKPTKDNSSTPAEGLPEINFLDWSPLESARPLKACEGDCDIDRDCGEGLRCFQRYGQYEKVPGCIGGELDDSLADYCAPIGATLMPTTMTPTKSPSKSPSKEPRTTVMPTVMPTATPTKSPSKSPSKQPTNEPTTGKKQVNGAPPSINCQSDDYDNINFDRMCKEDSCCSTPRSSGGFCEEMYTLLGHRVESACHHCCIDSENAGVPREVGPAAVVNPDIPQTIACDQIGEAYKICRANECCDGGDNTDFCKSQFVLYPDDMESICWYCCYPSYDVDFGWRALASAAESEEVHDRGLKDMEVRENDRVSYDNLGRKVVLREENYEPHGTEEDQQKYFDEMFSAHQRRQEETPIVENYDDVFWWPYEWLLKVGSEYYFRYEGTQTTPPCINKAHWRLMKDPIRVAPHQIKELERIIAWRINDQCQADTAGKKRDDGNLDAVDVNRPLQSYNELHRMVFCECQNWPSKFPQERSWCRNWKIRDPAIRFEQQPYNWQQQGY